ncbi:carbonic anhydrase-like [Babylonia areolata]|uniref:carbonic anhydrase-like n=1 Tax=Babylonia areolata TaxID=304850 RepID=UPI003FD292A2
MAAAWGYGASDGPCTWDKSFPDAKGKRQSPINIVTSQAEYDAQLNAKPLQMNYSPESAMCISNTGASMKADCEKGSTMTGGPLGDNVYKLIQFHLHWGSSDDKGAEHTIDGKVYSAELHLVHWNSTAYGSFSEAANKSDGLAVLCMFIKVGNSHKGFELVSRELSSVTFKGACCKASETFDPTCLLPGNTKRYWTYPGSLTTPPCYESVQFILFEEVIEFSADQMKALRSMHFGGEGSQCMMDNFRPTCPVGARKVRVSFQ